MLYFFLGIALLILGYFTYGTYIARVLKLDPKKEMPALAKRDGVDFLPLPHWKNMLIQLLNIAGVGPVIGVIIGIKFGELVFLIIPIGNIIAGATHDFLSGVMSIRRGGANLPVLIKDNLGRGYFRFFSVFSALLLILVVAVFINTPAQIIDSNFSKVEIFWWAVGGIFFYYILATLFPIDKIIGKIYPIFGALLILGTFALFAALTWGLISTPDMLSESETFRSVMWRAENDHPIVPLLFVTIACGIISGFHATQSPIIARTMTNERQAHSAFYGMMILEGIIAMIWAAGALAIYNLFPETFAMEAPDVLVKITKNFLGEWIGLITIIGVVILAVTSGDTAMRSLRLSTAEIFKIDQKSLVNRLAICAPIILLVLGLLAWSNMSKSTFNQLWNYFSWANQVLAASTLMAAAVWLFRQGRNFWVALVPGMFMSFIVLSYIIWISPEHGGPLGFGLDLHLSYIIAAALTLLAAGFAYLKGKKLRAESGELLECKDNF